MLCMWQCSYRSVPASAKKSVPTVGEVRRKSINVTRPRSGIKRTSSVSTTSMEIRRMVVPREKSRYFSGTTRAGAEGRDQSDIERKALAAVIHYHMHA